MQTRPINKVCVQRMQTMCVLEAMLACQNTSIREINFHSCLLVKKGHARFPILLNLSGSVSHVCCIRAFSISWVFAVSTAKASPCYEGGSGYGGQRRRVLSLFTRSSLPARLLHCTPLRIPSVALHAIKQLVPVFLPALP